MVSSFGRDTAKPASEPLDHWPRIELPAIGMPVVLVVDPVSLERAVQQIQERIAAAVVAAVRDGFEQAVGAPLPEPPAEAA